MGKYIGRDNPYGLFEKQVLNSDGSETSFDLNYTVGSAESLLVVSNGAVLQPGSDYDLDAGGAKIQFNIDPPPGALYVLYLGRELAVATGISSGPIVALTQLSDVFIQIPSEGQVLKFDGSAWVNSDVEGTFSGDYNDLRNKPVIPDVTALQSNINSLLSTTSTHTSQIAALQSSISAIDLNALSDVAVSSPSSGQILKYNGSSWINSANETVANLEDLQNVSITSLSTNQILKYNGTNWVNSTPTSIPTTLDGLDDVAVVSPQTDQVLRYTGSVWVNSSLPTVTGLATVATTGSYNDLIDKPNLPEAGNTTNIVVNNFNTNLTPVSNTLTIDCSLGTVFLGQLTASVSTWNFTNIPATNGKATNVTVVIDGNTSYTYGSNCSVDGASIADGVLWSKGLSPRATSELDMLSFCIIKDNAGSVKVLGSSTFNYNSATLEISGPYPEGPGGIAIQGLLGWYDANEVSTIRNASDEVVSSYGELVYEWHNKANTNNEHYLRNSGPPGGVSYIPNALNGLPGIYFDGTSFISLQNDSNFELGSFTIFTVMLPETTLGSAYQAIGSSLQDTSDGYFNMAVNLNSTWGVGGGTGPGDIKRSYKIGTANEYIVPTAARVICHAFHANANNVLSYASRTSSTLVESLASYTETYPDNQPPPNIYNYQGGFPQYKMMTYGASGFIFEHIVYARPLDFQERISVLAYLGSKWYGSIFVNQAY